MRTLLFVLALLLGSVSSSFAYTNFGISIGINVPAYPQLVQVPGYPVYYAPQLNANYFFYDGLYWVYDGENWYASEWYNGPWELVPPDEVPLFILRVPVRYYRHPPAYFHVWSLSAPPRWGQHWGHRWEERHRGWDHWNRQATPAPAPLPTYQRQYAGTRYPRLEQQQVLQRQHYQYRPHDRVAQRHYERTPTTAQILQQPQALPPQFAERGRRNAEWQAQQQQAFQQQQAQRAQQQSQQQAQQQQIAQQRVQQQAQQ